MKFGFFEYLTTLCLSRGELNRLLSGKNQAASIAHSGDLLPVTLKKREKTVGFEWWYRTETLNGVVPGGF